MDTGTIIASYHGGTIIHVKAENFISIIEMLGGEGALEIGDVVRGNLTSLGGETIWRDNEAFEVFVQDYG